MNGNRTRFVIIIVRGAFIYCVLTSIRPNLVMYILHNVAAQTIFLLYYFVVDILTIPDLYIVEHNINIVVAGFKHNIMHCLIILCVLNTSIIIITCRQSGTDYLSVVTFVVDFIERYVCYLNK